MRDGPDDLEEGNADGTDRSVSAGPFSRWSGGGGAGGDPTPEGDHYPTAATFTDESDPPSGPPLLPSDSRVGIDPELGPQDSIGIQGPPQPGQVLFGRYLVERLIGEGGMGTVWLVKHLELNALRALKLIVSGIAFDPQAQARFKLEAQVMARLSHPNAVVVHDARMARDAAFIEMEFIRGVSLNKRLSPGVPMPAPWTDRLLEQLCDVLDEAHAQKIVHRDLKPANLMLVDGRVPGRELKVLDFGIAKIVEGDVESGNVHTKTDCFLGSAPYSSPEQATNGRIDSRSDLYSVGVILYELLTGHRPFSGPITRLIYDHVYTSPPPFADRNPALRLPAAVEQVVRRCLAKNPADRFPTAKALAGAFHSAVTEGGGGVVGEIPIPSPFVPETDEATEVGTDALLGEDELAESPTSRSKAVTHDDLRVGHRHPPSSDIEVTERDTAAEGVGRPVVLDESSQVGHKSWEPAPPSLWGRLRRRPRLLAAIGVGLVASLFAAGRSGFQWARDAGASLPEGYRADEAEGWAGGVPLVLVRDRDRARFHRIEGGLFRLGNDFDPTGSDQDDDHPAHPVVVSDFYLQETEVTNGEMDAYFRDQHVEKAARPKKWRDGWEKIDRAGKVPANFPAVGITHDLATRYARWAGGRLPTEAQWEYAARSRGERSAYAWGNEPKADRTHANVDSIGLLGDIPTSEVRTYRDDRTKQGIYDMIGNVREWCRDVWAPYAKSEVAARDPQGPVPKGKWAEHAIRGGSWALYADRVRTTRPRHREDGNGEPPPGLDDSEDDLGFRVVIEWPRATR